MSQHVGCRLNNYVVVWRGKELSYTNGGRRIQSCGSRASHHVIRPAVSCQCRDSTPLPRWPMPDIGRRSASPKQPLNDDPSDTINVRHSRKRKSVGFTDLEASEARSTKTRKPQAPKTSQPKTDHPCRQ